MKKIIVSIFVLIGFISFAGAAGVTNNCVINPMNPGCLGREAAMKKQCTDGGGTPTINGTNCNCLLLIPNTRTIPCENVVSLEDIALQAANCEGGKLLKDGTCCPSGMNPYDKDKSDDYKKCCNGQLYNNNKKCCEKGVGILSGDKCLDCSSEEAETLPDYKKYCSEDVSTCDSKKIYTDSKGLERCCAGIVETDSQTQKKVCILNLEGNLGININTGCLVNGQCSYNIYKTLGIRKSDQNPSVSTFVSDIILGITMFLGTVISIILVVSGILYILAAIQGKSSLADMAKKGIINSIIGLLLVTGSYGIVRLVQFIATGGS